MLSLLGSLIFHSSTTSPKPQRERSDGLQGPHEERRTRIELCPCSLDYPKLKIEALKDGCEEFNVVIHLGLRVLFDF